MITEAPVPQSSSAARDLRRRIDRSVSRALVDGEFAARLLTDPAVALEDHGCPPQQLKSLLSIRASDVTDFCRQAQALFWLVEPRSAAVPQIEDDRSLPAAATR